MTRTLGNSILKDLKAQGVQCEVLEEPVREATEAEMVEMRRWYRRKLANDNKERMKNADKKEAEAGEKGTVAKVSKKSSKAKMKAGKKMKVVKKVVKKVKKVKGESKKAS